MLRTYSKNITVSANSAIPFNVDKIDVGNSVEHSNPSSIVIKKPGYYKVNFDASITGAAATATIQLYADGVAIPDAVIIQTLVADSNSNVSFSTILRARPGAFDDDVTLTIVPNADLTITSTAFGINKVA